jgi:flagellar L-ring protein FlgH
MKRKRLLVLFSLFLISSCSSYVSKIYKQLDREEKVMKKNRRDVFDQFRKTTKETGLRPPISTKETNTLKPRTKRLYKKPFKKRFSADDLNENSNSSLWFGNGFDNDFFVENKRKKNGDIILVEIKPKLRNIITRELKKAFPKRKRKKIVQQGEASETKKPKEEDNEKEKDESNLDETVGQLSSVVTEEINNSYMIVRGRKEVLFRKRKRLIEIQGLIARKDVTPDDKITSDKFLESSIKIIR